MSRWPTACKAAGRVSALGVWLAALGGLAVCVVCAAEQGSAQRREYRSPYSVRLPFSREELIPDLLRGERGDPRLESKAPHSEWYSKSRHIGPWGPLPREYPPPEIAHDKGVEWKRARVLATALRFVGYHYRHHYIPDWDPPEGWHTPAEGSPRHDGKGVDCSNFTAFVYNQALGLGFSSDIHKQAAMTHVLVHGSERTERVEVIERRGSVEAWKDALRPGDLLFIRPRSGEGISHVVIWVGEWGEPGDAPLILDSHGADTRDANGVVIPNGIHLRPFREGSWYAECAAHAVRIVFNR